jgi:hypothetical protein
MAATGDSRSHRGGDAPETGGSCGCDRDVAMSRAMTGKVSRKCNRIFTRNVGGAERQYLMTTGRLEGLADCTVATVVACLTAFERFERA